MSNFSRLGFGFAWTVGLSLAGIIYAQVFRGPGGLYLLATEEFTGPFTTVVDALNALVPVLLVVMLLGGWLFVIAGGVQEEKARRRVR